MKEVGNTIYVHKSNIHELLDKIPDDNYKIEIIRLYEFRKQPGSLPYEVIKYDTKQHKLSFIESPDWDTSSEPTVGDCVCWNFDKQSQTFRCGGTQIYHSKELFISDDYKGFDIQKAKERTKLWQSLVTKEEKKLIGNKNYWKQFCEKHGIDL